MKRPLRGFLLALLLALPVFLPLQLALGWLSLPHIGLEVREAEGTVWSGRLRGASLHGLALGDLGVGLSPLQLLLGTRALRVTGKGEDGAHRLRLLQGRRNGVDGAEGRFHANGLAGLPGVGMDVDFAQLAVVFTDGHCARAQGSVRASLAWPGQEAASTVLSGSPQCADRAAVLPLRSESGSARIEAELRIEADGRYRVQAVVRDADPAASLVLRQAGFVEGPAGLSRSQDGRLSP